MVSFIGGGGGGQSTSAAWSGWGVYNDTQYTDVSPFALAASTDTILPNNRGSLIESQKPSDLATFYDGTVINGMDGDSILITLDAQVIPTNAGTTYIEFWYDIGGTVGELYRRTLSFPKGSGVLRPVVLTTNVYTLGTWETNGATVYCRANGTADIYNIRYVISRVHKAR